MFHKEGRKPLKAGIMAESFHFMVQIADSIFIKSGLIGTFEIQVTVGIITKVSRNGYP